MKRFGLALVCLVLVLSLMTVIGCKREEDEKPVIYLYPDEIMEVSLRLNYSGEITSSYPSYEEGWKVLAHPDGSLIDLRDGREYSYLFWEGISDIDYDMTRGFVVKGEDTADFLREKLAYLGLIPREYNEFIVYWLPRMQKNSYNLISFQDQVYTDNASLEVSPEPDSQLRIFMAYRPLKKPVDVEDQELEPFERQGFTLIEWGGAVVN